jgi:DNA polymerase III delta subunit
MIILLWGPDDYRREAKRRELIAEFKKKHSHLGLDFFDFSLENARERFQNFVDNQSIFEPVKLGILTGLPAVSDPKLPEALKKFSQDPKINLLISETREPDRAFAFLKDKRKVLVQEFPILRGAAWRAFLRQEARKLGVNLAPSAFEFLAAAYEGDSWRLITELQKLSLLSRREIKLEDLERLAIELTPDFWETLRGLKSPNLGRRLLTLEKLFARNEPAGKIFNILAYQWQEKLPRFAAYDLAVKSGRCDYEEVLVDLLIS